MVGGAASLGGTGAVVLPAPEDELEGHIAKALRSGASPLGHDLLAPLVRASPLFFAQMYLKGPPAAPFYGRLLFNAQHYAWEDLVTQKKRYVVLAARGSGKSAFFSYICVLWRIVTQPDQQQFLFGGTEYAAQRTLEAVRLEIESNPKLNFLQPTGSSRRWKAGQIRCSNGHDVTARGMLTRVRGAHPDAITCDDILTDEDGWSEVKRRRTEDYYYSTISNMIMPGGQLGVAGTPQNVRDVVMLLFDNPAYAGRVDPALTEGGESAWPEVYSTAWLKAHRKEIGSVRFAREKLCKPVSDESSLFPRSLFHQGDTMQPMARLGAPLSYWRSVGIVEQFIGIDFAFSTSVAADFFVIMVIGLDEQDNHWVLDIYRDRGVSFSEQKAWIVTYGRRYDPRIMNLEANAAQQVAADELKRQTDLPIRKFVTTSAKHSLEDGLPSLRILLENNKIRLPRGDARSVELTDKLIEEANNFSWIKGEAKSVGGHDDMVLSLYICEQGVRRARHHRLMAPGSSAAQTPAPPVGPAPPPANVGQALSGQRAAPKAPTVRATGGLLQSRGPEAGLPPAQTVLRNGVYVRVTDG